jgi:chromosome segregation ATPase
MKAAAILALAIARSVAADEVSPVGKVLQLLSDLQTKVIGEGEKSQKVYEEFSEWCEERSKNLAFDIKTGEMESAELKATISDEAALTAALTTKAEKLASDIATDQADLKASTFIREKEAAEFLAEKTELSEIIDTLERAIGLLEKHAASMLQLKSAGTVADALAVMVKASMFSSADANRLNAFVQQGSEDGGDNMGAPSAAVYEGHSAGIVATLTDLLEKAQAQLQEASSTETTNLHAFEQLKQSIEDEIAYGEKELAEAKAGIAASGEKKATAEGDLSSTTADLDTDVKTKADLHQECMTKAQEFEAEVKSRAEELKALAEAKKALVDNTGAADSLSYGLSQVSLFQKLTSGTDLAHFEAVRFVRDLARKQNSKALAQLASRMATAVRMSSGGADPFSKVKGLIADMIERLEKEAGADAKHKAYCDKEIAYADEKKANRISEIEKLTTSIDQMSARSAQLKEEVAALEKSLADLAASQAAMDKLRAQEHADFLSNKADMEQGLKGVKMALSVLTEYYAKDGKAHDEALGSGEGIIGLLEVVESDFTKGLAEYEGTEESAQAEYEQATKDIEIETATKSQDVKYKVKESKDLDKATAEATSDRSGVQTELAAVNKYLESLHAQCDETVDSYEEQVRRRTAELAGLKQALTILEGEAALLQQASRRKARRAGQQLRA